jgi:hypothetical protein
LDRHERRRPAHQHGAEHQDHFARVGCQEIVDELADVVVDRATLLDGVHDRCEVVVRQHDVRGFLGHVGARDAHGNADVGGLDGGCVIDPVARHRHDLPQRFPRLHD